MWKMLALAWELGYVIAVPLVGFAIGGVVLDRAFQSKPLFFLIGILLAIIISTCIVCKKVAGALQDVSNQEKKK